LWHGRRGSGTKSTKKMTAGLDERNYHPITLLSTVDGVYESMMSIHVNNHLDSKLEPCLSVYTEEKTKL